MNTPTSLLPIWDRFVGNMGSLWFFLQEIGKLADEKEQDELEELTRSVAEIFGFDPNELNNYFGQLLIPTSETEIDISPELIKKVKDELAELKTTDAQTAYKEWVDKNPDKLIPLYKLIQRTTKQPPAHGKILRRGAFVMMYSFFEMLLADLVRVFYSMYTDALTQSDKRMISLSELREFSSLSISDIENHFIAKEVDNILRENLQKQLDYFKGKPGISLAPLSKYREALNEISQRRNLIMHTDGFVDDRYLAITSAEFRETRGIEKNVRLNITMEYFQAAFDTLLIFGAAITQICWRKWLKSDGGKADKALSDVIFFALERGRCLAVRELAQMTPNLKVSLPYSLAITLNHAIAERELGEKKNLARLIKELSGFPMSPDLKIALSVLREDYERTYELLQQAKKDEQIYKMSIDWPLFHPIRYEERLIEIFRSGSTLSYE